VFAGNTVWSTPERLRGEVLTTRRYTNLRLPLPYTETRVPGGWFNYIGKQATTGKKTARNSKLSVSWWLVYIRQPTDSVYQYLAFTVCIVILHLKYWNHVTYLEQKSIRNYLKHTREPCRHIQQSIFLKLLIRPFRTNALQNVLKNRLKTKTRQLFNCRKADLEGSFEWRAVVKGLQDNGRETQIKIRDCIFELLVVLKKFLKLTSSRIPGISTCIMLPNSVKLSSCTVCWAAIN